MLRIDLGAAGVPYYVEGVGGKEYADFHALRHTFVTELAASGTGAKELQTLARHSDPRLTLGVYSHARSDALVAAVGRLRIPGAGPAPSPLAHLDREQLERTVFGLCRLLDTLLATAEYPPAPVTTRVTPRVGISGDSAAQPGIFGSPTGEAM